MHDQQPGEHHQGADLFPQRLRRFIPLLAVIAMSLAIVGYISASREHGPRPVIVPKFTGTASPVHVAPAVTYSELPSAELRPQSAARQTLAELKFEMPGLFDTVVRTEEMKLAALADRARNRAYDGAPPTMPHPAAEMTDTACLACHGQGLKVGDRVATRMSHAHFSNCTQCHVEQLELPAESAFVGAFRSGPGERASPGAPPTIPHHTWMREDCMSCHGLVARPGLRTTHPWLSNCTQCHAPSAQLDQARFLSGGGR